MFTNCFVELWKLITDHVKALASIDQAKKNTVASLFARTIYSGRYGKASEKDDIIRNVTEFLKSNMKPNLQHARQRAQTAPPVNVLRQSETTPALPTETQKKNPTTSVLARTGAGKRTSLFMANNPFSKPMATRFNNNDSSDSEDGGSILQKTMKQSTSKAVHKDSDSDFD
jgi:hypothetical protein